MHQGLSIHFVYNLGVDNIALHLKVPTATQSYFQVKKVPAARLEKKLSA